MDTPRPITQYGGQYIDPEMYKALYNHRQGIADKIYGQFYNKVGDSNEYVWKPRVIQDQSDNFLNAISHAQWADAALAAQEVLSDPRINWNHPDLANIHDLSFDPENPQFGFLHRIGADGVVTKERIPLSEPTGTQGMSAWMNNQFKLNHPYFSEIDYKATDGTLQKHRLNMDGIGSFSPGYNKYSQKYFTDRNAITPLKEPVQRTQYELPERPIPYKPVTNWGIVGLGAGAGGLLGAGIAAWDARSKRKELERGGMSSQDARKQVSTSWLPTLGLAALGGGAGYLYDKLTQKDTTGAWATPSK
jgi:hypothetical protein